MLLDEITEKMAKKFSGSVPINARVKFDFGDEGRIFIDGTQSPPRVSHDDEDADTTLVCSVDTLVRIVDGTQDPNIAFLTGKLKIQGSMGIAMKLNTMLED